MSSIDLGVWASCSLVEANPRVHSGELVIKNTRLPVSAILDNYEAGVTPSKIAEQFQVGVQTVHAILSFAAQHRLIPSTPDA